MWARKIHEDWKTETVQTSQKEREEKRMEDLEEAKQISKLDYEIWSLQINPMAQNIISSEKNLEIFSERIRSFKCS